MCIAKGFFKIFLYNWFVYILCWHLFIGDATIICLKGPSYFKHSPLKEGLNAAAWTWKWTQMCPRTPCIGSNRASQSQPMNTPTTKLLDKQKTTTSLVSLGTLTKKKKKRKRIKIKAWIAKQLQRINAGAGMGPCTVHCGRGPPAECKDVQWQSWRGSRGVWEEHHTGWELLLECAGTERMEKALC